jgi:bifunctional NMN adenylyltransferase/nudix hydrolase
MRSTVRGGHPDLQSHFMNTLPYPYRLSVYIGRFQPFHCGHLALLIHALQLAPRCVVVVGSAFRARTAHNPFTWQERAQMVRASLPVQDQDRVDFLPVRDYFDEVQWNHAVRCGVTELQADAQNAVVLVGHFKDDSSGYLARFPAWQVAAMPRQHQADGAALRALLFGQAGEPALQSIAPQVPAGSLDFLRAWTALPHYANLANEWALLEQHQQAWAHAPYPPVFVTADAVVCCAGHVLLIRRAQAPGQGLWALPGGYIEQRETVYQAVIRELSEETQLDVVPQLLDQTFKAVQVFDHPGRSLRGRVITHAHHFELDLKDLPAVQAGDDAQSVQWVALSTLRTLESQLHDDHFHILQFFVSYRCETIESESESTKRIHAPPH